MDHAVPQLTISQDVRDQQRSLKLETDKVMQTIHELESFVIESAHVRGCCDCAVSANSLDVTDVMEHFELYEKPSKPEDKHQSCQPPAEPKEERKCATCRQGCSTHEFHDEKSEAESAKEIFKNGKLAAESESENPLSHSVSMLESSSLLLCRKPTTAHRVNFNSFFHVEGIPRQVEPIGFLEDASDDELPSDSSRKLSRLSIRCPITSCGALHSPSDFCDHIKIDHPFIGIVKVQPNNLINMQLSHTASSNAMTCQRLFLVDNKLK